MNKKIIVFLIIAILLVGGGFFIFLSKSDILSNNPFLASLAGFFSFGNNQKKTFSLSEEEFSSLKQRIAFLEESLGAREEELENLDSLIEKFDVLSQKIITLEAGMQVRAGEISEIEGQEETAQEEELEEEELEEPEEGKEVGQGVGQKLCGKMPGAQPFRNKIIINEIAWMGTTNSANDEWIELKNISGGEINFNDWQLLDKDNQIKIIFDIQHRVLNNGFLLLERTSDDSVAGVKADLIYAGSLGNTNEALYLFDENCQLQDEVIADSNWSAGDNSSKRTMERKTDLSWQTSSDPGGTPKAENSSGYVVIPSVGGGGGGAPPSPVVYPKILITEVRISPLTERFVELYNPNNQTIDLTEWYIQRKIGDGEPSTFVSSSNFEGKTIGSHFLITHPSSTGAVDANILLDITLTPNNTLLLKNPNREIVDEISWQDIQEGFSYGRAWDDSTDNYLYNFEIQEPTPKEKNKSPVLPQDSVPPQVAFSSLSPIQTTLSFTILWSGEDLAPEGVTPSGIEGFLLRYSEDKESWNYWPAESEYTQETQYLFTGEDEKTYYFQIKAKDVAGNESELLPEIPVFTKISVPKKILINEIQIDSIVGTGGASDDWVELYNPYDINVSLAGWSIQKHSKSDPCSTDTSFYKKNFSDDAIIPAKGFYLVVGSGAREELKNIADMTIGWSLSENNTVYLVRKTEKIGSGEDDKIIDKVGFGLACFAETEPFLNPPEAKSIQRRELSLDINDNSQDFEINDIPTPTNSKGETI